jgi:hypothetical protein
MLREGRWQGAITYWGGDSHGGSSSWNVLMRTDAGEEPGEAVRHDREGIPTIAHPGGAADQWRRQR